MKTWYLMILFAGVSGPLAASVETPTARASDVRRLYQASKNVMDYESFKKAISLVTPEACALPENAQAINYLFRTGNHVYLKAYINNENLDKQPEKMHTLVPYLVTGRHFAFARTLLYRRMTGMNDENDRALVIAQALVESLIKNIRTPNTWVRPPLTNQRIMRFFFKLAPFPKSPEGKKKFIQATFEWLDTSHLPAPTILALKKEIANFRP